jgi:universal stress protein E
MMMTNNRNRKRMNSIKHILVVIHQFAEGHQASVDKAAFLARCTGASVELLVCKTKADRDDSSALERAGEAHQADTRLQALLDSLASGVRAQGSKVSIQIIQGQTLHDSVLDYVRRSDADLLIKDTRHHSLAKRTLLRNTDWYLAHRCPVPVLLTKAKEWASLPIIMAALGPKSASARAAELDHQILNCAASLAGGINGDLHVIHTYVPVALARARSSADELATDLEVEDAYERGQIEESASAFGVAAPRLHIEMGTPERCLPDSVTRYHADVIVIGASLHGRWHRMIVGSTASSVLESLPCDVLIVTPPSSLPRSAMR